MVRWKRLVKLLRIPPFGSSDPNILFNNSIAALLTVRRSSVTPIFNPLIINNNKICSFNSFTCVFSFYSSNPHSFRLSLVILIYSLIITPFVRNFTPSLRCISIWFIMTTLTPLSLFIPYLLSLCFKISLESVMVWYHRGRWGGFCLHKALQVLAIHTSGKCHTGQIPS